MLIKPFKHNIYDVFLNNGFMQWSRVKRTHYGCSVIAGQKLPHHIIRDIARHL